MLKQFAKRFYILIKRQVNAKKIGVTFIRASKWSIPDSVILNGKKIGLRLLNDVSTKTAFMDIFLDDCYGLDFFKRSLHKIDNIVDVGANQGLFLLYARNKFEYANIHAYEPNKLIIPQLAYHANLATSTYFNESVGLHCGKTFLEEGHDSLHGRTIENELGDISQVSLKVCLDRVNGYIDILKMDCEGAEWEILKDFESFKKVRAITLEYHLVNEQHHGHIIAVIKSHKFRIVRYCVNGPTWGLIWAINDNLN